MSDDERPRPSWSEIDRRREKGRREDDRRPRGRHAEARARQATQTYLKEIDKIFTGGPGGEESDRLAREIQAAHGTPALKDACRAYRDALGMPPDPALLGLFLDCDDPELVVAGLEALLALQAAGRLEIGRGLQSQLRVLAESFDDAVASAAEELLDAL